MTTTPEPKPIDMRDASSTDELRMRLDDARGSDVVLTPVEGGEPMVADEPLGWGRDLDAPL